MNPRFFLAALATAALLGGCATKDYVNEQIAGVNKRVDGQQAETSDRFGKTASLIQGLENRVNSQQTALDGASRTAQEALERANAAGKLAAGKFLYETTLTSQIAFGFDGSTLSEQAKQALDDFAAKIKAENRNVYIEIQGHTDSSGTEASNLRIGEARAEAVRRYLAIQHGFALHRMNVISYGESAPIASNKTRTGRAENRRVTLVVLQ
ncbi:MAG: OmpA family protein [Thiobacillus sp.]|nr:OmpA family protein [Thiobacillus sp.]